MQAKTTPINKKQFQLYEGIVVKFLINLPAQQRKQQSRLSYHAQKAWYYYLDSVLQLKDDSTLTSSEKYTFFEKLRQYSPKSLHINPDIIVSKLSQNKPTCGAIIMNESQTKVLVIKNKDDKLGFPKGKWNQSERPEDCAARQVYEQIGIYIHSRIDPSQKIEFIGFGSVPSIFFVVKGIKESEKFNIDKKEICQVFWMNVNDVTRYIKRFVSKSRSAWKIYIEEFSEPKLAIEQFIEFYKPRHNHESEKHKKSIEKQKYQSPQKGTLLSEETNPFLSFKLDHEKLLRVFAK